MCRDGEEGLLVEPGAEREMSRALATLLADPARRAAMGERGRQRVATLFTPEAQLATIIEHLRLRAGADRS
jgi:glycosyltransferase involved in cell wall biosynthesis